MHFVSCTSHISSAQLLLRASGCRDTQHRDRTSPATQEALLAITALDDLKVYLGDFKQYLRASRVKSY